MSLSVALLFPVLFLWLFWGLGLDGIWLNFVGVNALAALLAVALLVLLEREIRKRKREKAQKTAATET